MGRSAAGRRGTVFNQVVVEFQEKMTLVAATPCDQNARRGQPQWQGTKRIPKQRWRAWWDPPPAVWHPSRGDTGRTRSICVTCWPGADILVWLKPHRQKTPLRCQKVLFFFTPILSWGLLFMGSFSSWDKHWLCLSRVSSPYSCLLGMTGPFSLFFFLFLKCKLALEIYFLGDVKNRHFLRPKIYAVIKG